MMPTAMFASRAFVGVSVLTFLLYGALSGFLVIVPYALIELFGYSITEAGAALLPLPVLLAVFSPIMGRFAGRIGPRLPLSLGPMVVAVGMLLATRLSEGGSYGHDVLPAILVVAIGMTGAVAPLTGTVLSAVDPRFTGVASGLNSALARTGGLVATALVGGLLGVHGAALAPLLAPVAVCGAIAAALAGLVAWRSL
jgi:predicted MFS family arabinose efflux permease